MENLKVSGIVSIPSTELPSGQFVDIRAAEGHAYLLTIGVISAPQGACDVSIRDATGGMSIFQAPAGTKSAGGCAVSNHDSWIRIQNLDFSEGSIASYAAAGIVVKVQI